MVVTGNCLSLLKRCPLRSSESVAECHATALYSNHVPSADVFDVFYETCLLIIRAAFQLEMLTPINCTRATRSSILHGREWPISEYYMI